MEARVSPVANAIGGETFAASKAATEQWLDLMTAHGNKVPDEVARSSLMFKENRAWIEGVKQQGYTILDVGAPQGVAEGTFYTMEKGVVYGIR